MAKDEVGPSRFERKRVSEKTMNEERLYTVGCVLESQSEREHRIRRNVKLIVAIMSVFAAIFVIGVAITNPEFLAMALVLGLIVVVLPVVYYLYFARWIVIVGTRLVKIGTWLDK